MIHPACRVTDGIDVKVLLDLLSASRHGPVKSHSSSTITAQNDEKHATKGTKCPRSLASVTLDTLLCVLVDMPEATRTFEESNGVELVVKTLKRASIPRDVRSVIRVSDLLLV